MNHVIIVGKTMLAKQSSLSIEVLWTRVKLDMKIEKGIAFKVGKMNEYEKKWSCLLMLREEQAL